MDLYRALVERRSIRKYKPDPVSPEKVKKVLEAARIAPSWKNMQCWKFIVISNVVRKEQLSACLHEGNPAVRAIKTAPQVIALCADPQESGNLDGKDYYLLDAGLAMQQLMLAAYAEGLGTCWVAWFDEAKARAVLKSPPEYRIVAMTPLGVPETQSSPRPRKDLREIVYAEEWGQTWV
ncbi:MAG: nitroreductase family protein [Bacillota bacterium]